MWKELQKLAIDNFDLQSAINNLVYTEEKPMGLDNKLSETNTIALVDDLLKLRGINREDKWQTFSDPHVKRMAERMKQYGYESNLIESQPVLIYVMKNGDIYRGWQ